MINTDRDQFLGIHVTWDVKKALRERADKEKTSMSEVAFGILARYFRTEVAEIREREQCAESSDTTQPTK